MLEETDGSGTLQNSYTLGLDVLTQAEATGEVYHLLTDAHGSTRLLTDDTGSVIETYTYDAYGEAVGFDAEAAKTTFLYSGEQWETELPPSGRAGVQTGEAPRFRGQEIPQP